MFEPDTDNPFALFDRWYREASESETNDPNAMTVATADADGRPSARILLLKDFDEHGFVFYSNFESQKGRELTINPFAALCFHWKSVRRQVRVSGPVVRVGDGEADAYFNSRPRGSRVGAWASQQSRPLADRDSLMAAVEKADKEYPGENVPRPPYWSGWRLTPLAIEFWQDGEFRLHDRFRFTRAVEGEPWKVDRLFP
ncbi:pyridoxamine 5'-phosphate oxidase [Nisaea acidiphila]|uniref:Pyridoxine/pyridoxamine 5'-phosphate oxidase n=1 Tax=Nisaea acidiphila TaxID=1862145 RepID=A0A9J7AW20_9PROT|nr:pyridoxamine 5'-phosphate oxidase [Nisaea acidiphila]UUX51504.1 pyridoxamine 5'-phosphate oxidase [Nisaea acidiphila]